MMHQFNQFRIFRFTPVVDLSTPQFHTDPSVQHKDYTFSATKISQFNTKNPTVQHEKFLSSIVKPLSSTQFFYIELRDFRCWSEGFSALNWALLNWRVLSVELRDFGGWNGVALLCWTDVLKWEGPYFMKSVSERCYSVHSRLIFKGWEVL